MRDSPIFSKNRGVLLLMKGRGMDMLDALEIQRGLHFYEPRYLQNKMRVR
jgi:hypothetical protein